MSTKNLCNRLKHDHRKIGQNIFRFFQFPNSNNTLAIFDYVFQIFKNSTSDQPYYVSSAASI